MKIKEMEVDHANQVQEMERQINENIQYFE
jgi:hypothetical protein